MRSRTKRWRRIAPLTLLLASVGACAPGRTVLVTDDSPMRIGPGTTAKVYLLLDGEWSLSAQAVALPEGWYLVPPRFVAPEDLPTKRAGSETPR